MNANVVVPSEYSLENLIQKAVTYKLEDTTFNVDFQNHKKLTLDIVCENIVDAVSLYGEEKTLEVISSQITNLFISMNIGIDWCMKPDDLDMLLQPIQDIPLIQTKLDLINSSHNTTDEIIDKLMKCQYLKNLNIMGLK